MLTKRDKRLCEMKAAVIAAIGHPIRLGAVEFLVKGEQCVCDIATHLGAQRSNVSRHLAVLVKAGVLEHRKDGLKMIYSLKTPCLLDFTTCVERVLKQRAHEAASVLESLKAP